MEAPVNHPILSTVPSALHQRRWCRWHLQANAQGRPTKRPTISVHSASALRELREVLADGPITPSSGVGFVLQGGAQDDSGGHLVALDLDACRHPDGTVADWAAGIVHAAGSYTEITPSGAGLRVWVSVEDLASVPRGRGKPDALPLPSSPKRPDCQVFSTTGYVTVSGQHLLGTPRSITRHETLHWLRDFARFADAELSAARAPLSPDAPSRAKIEASCRLHKHFEALKEARWKEVCPDKSASDGWFSLSAMVVAAAGYHEDAAVDYLLSLDWGARVEESMDPAKYSRESWVRADVRRVAARSRPPEFALVTQELLDSIPAPVEAVEHPVSGSVIGTLEFLARRRAQRFTVDGLLPRVGLVQIYGAPGSGKTPFAMSLALHVAAGRPTWFGRAVQSHGPVVYMVGEDASGLGWRAEAELRAMGLTPESVDRTLLWTVRPGQLTDAADAERWYRELAPLAPRVLLIDTQSRNFGPGDENSTQDMTRYVTHLTTLAEALQALVIMVHHVSKGDRETARGSSVLHGALDASFLVKRTGDLTAAGEVVVTAIGKKSKNWADPEPLLGVLVPVEVEPGATAITLRQTTPEELASWSDDTPVLETALLSAWLVEHGPYTGAMKQLASDAGLTVGHGGRAGVATVRAALAEGLVIATKNPDDGRKITYSARTNQ